MNNNRVLFTAPRFHTNQYYLTKQLSEQQFNIRFLVSYKGKTENYKYITPVVPPTSRFCFSLKGRNNDNLSEKSRSDVRKNFLASFKFMFNEFKSFKPNYVVIRNLTTSFSVQTLFFALIFRCKAFVYTQNPLHQDISKKRRFIYGLLDRFGIKHYTPVLGNVSKSLIPKSFYIPFVIDALKQQSSAGTRENITIVTIGKMMPRKNLLELVFQLKKSNLFNCSKNSLTVIGECTTEANKEYLSELEALILHDKQILFKVDILTNIIHENVNELIEAGDLFILPSHDEPAAFSILEAMALGLPVICSNQNGTSCYIEDGVNGFVFPYSPGLDGLDSLIDRFLIDRSFITSAGNNSIRLVKERHQVDSLVRLFKSQTK